MNKLLYCPGGAFSGNISLTTEYDGEEWTINYEINRDDFTILKEGHIHNSNLNYAIKNLIQFAIEQTCWDLEDDLDNTEKK